MTGFLRHKRGILVASVIAATLAVAGPALTHSDLHRSEPADGAVLRATPAAVVLLFPAPMRVMTLRLLDDAGRETRLTHEGERTSATREARAVVQGRLLPGDYRIEWRGASEDGHVGGGTVRFRVDPAS